MSDHLYIHVPFCLKKCRYCDFYSQTDTALLPGYVDALAQEIKLRARACSQAGRSAVNTIYFGGGTPSVLPPSSIEMILHGISSGYGVASSAEITLEANPGTLDREYLRSIYSLGVNRLSLGVQSFDQNRLALLGRIHTVHQAVRAIETARDAGFNNIGLDLIYGLPGESESDWKNQMKQAVSFRPEHLSCYMLTLEPGTPLYREYEQGRFFPMAGDEQVDRFEFTAAWLERAGYLHYEISNFARERQWESRHNSAYWNMVPYSGFGPSAHSFSVRPLAEGTKTYRRSWNVPDIKRYIALLAQGRRPVQEEEILTRGQRLLEQVMVGLRTSKGIDIKTLKAWLKLARRLEKEGFGRLFQNEDRFALTRTGWMRFDNIIEAFADLV